MEKYNNGQPVEVPKETNEQAIAIKEWSEGSKHLQKAITSCINNGIETFASCKGHAYESSPYLSVKVTKENLGQIINIINNLSDKNLISLSLSFNEINESSLLSVYPNTINKNNIFDLIASSSEKKLEFEKANEITQEMVRLHGTLRKYGAKHERMTTDIELDNGVIGRKISILHGKGSYDYLLDRELQDSSFRKNRADAFILRESKLKKGSKLKEFNNDLITTILEGNCEIVEDDELIEEIPCATITLNNERKKAFNERLQIFEFEFSQNDNKENFTTQQIEEQENTK